MGTTRRHRRERSGKDCRMVMKSQKPLKTCILRGTDLDVPVVGLRGIPEGWRSWRELQAQNPRLDELIVYAPAAVELLRGNIVRRHKCAREYYLNPVIVDEMVELWREWIADRWRRLKAGEKLDGGN